MITAQDEAQNGMTEEKKKMDYSNLVAKYLHRPISFMIAARFLNMNWTANRVTLLSMIPALLALPVMSFAHSVPVRILGGLLWWTWAILDSVDGDMARYTHSTSNAGGFLDAVGGYVAMWVWPLASGMAAYQDSQNSLFSVSMAPVLLVFLGALTSIFAIFPRLVMHKAIHMNLIDRDNNEFNTKQDYSLLKCVCATVIDPVGVPNYLYLLSCVAHTLDLFVLFYFLLYFVFCFATFWKMLATALKAGNAGEKET